MRLAFFDCFSGISGNMALGALIALGASPDRIAAELEKLGLGAPELEVSDVRRGALAAKHVRVIFSDKNESRDRTWEEIRTLLESAPIGEDIRDRSRRIFHRLAQAEAKVHQIPIERVSFHEVGAIDSIADIVGTCAGLAALGVSRVECSPLSLGSGSVDTRHGTLPLPAPATLELLSGMTVRGAGGGREKVTPTGAALLSALASRCGDLPSLKLLGVGYGAGDERGAGLPNVLRVVLGEVEEMFDVDAVCVIETNIDDLNPEVYAYVVDQLSEAGALDVSLVPIQMKKGRPGTLLRVIGREPDRERLAGVIFRESSAIGVRVTRAERMLLDRTETEVETPYGRVRVKIASDRGGIRSLHPSYEDCRRLAEARGVPLKRILEAALAAARTEFAGA
jgi:uncharacterized protein (TIGR00299 family) protein